MNGFRGSLDGKLYCLDLGDVVQRTAHGEAALVQDVGVDHGGLDVLVAQQFLDGANIVTRFKQVGGKAMAEGVTTGALVDPGPLDCFPDRLLCLQSGDHPG